MHPQQVIDGVVDYEDKEPGLQIDEDVNHFVGGSCCGHLGKEGSWVKRWQRLPRLFLYLDSWSSRDLRDH